MCVLGKLRHTQVEGARQAIALYEEILRSFPDDRGSQWLLNIAYMATGRYPSGVPKPYLIPNLTLRRDTTFPPFFDVAHEVGAAVNGLALGARYALVALGFVIIYRATGVINFAQGALVALGAYLTYAFANGAELPFALAVLLAVLCALGCHARNRSVLSRQASRSMSGGGVVGMIGVPLWKRSPAASPPGGRTRSSPR